MPSLWQTSLRQAQDRLQDLVSNVATVGSLLIESVNDTDDPLSDPLFDGRRDWVASWSRYAPGTCRTHCLEWGPRHSRPLLDLTQSTAHRKIPDGARELAGEFPPYWSIAADAGECLAGIPNDVARILPAATLRTDDPSLRWTYLVHDLAWLRLPGSGLTAEKTVWVSEQGSDSFSFHFMSLSEFRSWRKERRFVGRPVG